MPRNGKVRTVLVGAGRFGIKRAAAIARSRRSELAVIADVDAETARTASEVYGCPWTTDWHTAVGDESIQAVAVATPTRLLTPIGLAAARAGKHVLVEKPCAADATELLALVEAAEASQVCFKGGYNHRFHPAIRSSHELFAQGVIGRLLFLRCTYGHGGRVGYEKEWRSQMPLAGGGELLDQGVHALDLFRWFLGEFEEATGMVSTAFWPIAPAEDNVFAILRTSGGAIAQLHASWTHWKNTFTFEAFGEKGYLRACGLGGSYGTERLCCGLRARPGDVPQEEWTEFPGPDESLAAEWEEFVEAITSGAHLAVNGMDAWRTMQLTEAIYRSAREGQTARIQPRSAYGNTSRGTGRDGSSTSPLQLATALSPTQKS
jgi:predicted dehydrogenase